MGLAADIALITGALAAGNEAVAYHSGYGDIRGAHGRAFRCQRESGTRNIGYSAYNRSISFYG
jgi:hypothetical protein